MTSNHTMSKLAGSIQTIFILAVFLFWGLPFLKDFLPEKDAQEIILACKVLVNSFFCLVMSYQYYKENNFTWYLPIGLMMIFLPLPLLFYSISDLLYVPLYGVMSYLGFVLTSMMKKMKQKG